MTGIEELNKVNVTLDKINVKIVEAKDNEQRVQTLNRTKYLLVGNLQSLLKDGNMFLQLKILRRNDDRITFVFFWHGGKKKFFANKPELHEALNKFSQNMVSHDYQIHDIQLAGSTKIKILLEVKNAEKTVG